MDAPSVVVPFPQPGVDKTLSEAGGTGTGELPDKGSRDISVGQASTAPGQNADVEADRFESGGDDLAMAVETVVEWYPAHLGRLLA